MTTESREQDPGSARASRKSRGSPAIIEAGGSGGLDTSGEVALGPSVHVPGFSHRNSIRWPDLDAFTQGYIEALFAGLSVGGNWTGCLQTTHGDIHKCTFRDLAPETLARIIADCGLFQQCELAELRNAPEGRWLWTTRQGGLSEELAEDFPPLTVTLGGDGRAYLREQAHSDEIGYPTPLGALQFRMEQGGHTQADLAKLIGSRSRAAEILSGKRGLSKRHIRLLADEWGVPPRSLLGPAESGPSGRQGSGANTSEGTPATDEQP